MRDHADRETVNASNKKRHDALSSVKALEENILLGHVLSLNNSVATDKAFSEADLKERKDAQSVFV